MDKREIVAQYREEIDKQLQSGDSYVRRLEVTDRLYDWYLTRLKAMRKAGVLSREDYHWITDWLIVKNAEVLNLTF